MQFRSGMASALALACLLALASSGHGARVLKLGARRHAQEDAPMVISPAVPAHGTIEESHMDGHDGHMTNSTMEESSWDGPAEPVHNGTLEESSWNVTEECYPARVLNLTSASTGEWAEELLPVFYNNSAVEMFVIVANETVEVELDVFDEEINGTLVWTVSGPAPCESANCTDVRTVTFAIPAVNYTIDFNVTVLNGTEWIDAEISTNAMSVAVPLYVNATGSSIDTDLSFTLSGPTNETVCISTDEESSEEMSDELEFSEDSKDVDVQESEKPEDVDVQESEKPEDADVAETSDKSDDADAADDSADESDDADNAEEEEEEEHDHSGHDHQE